MECKSFIEKELEAAKQHVIDLETELRDSNGIIKIENIIRRTHPYPDNFKITLYGREISVTITKDTILVDTLTSILQKFDITAIELIDDRIKMRFKIKE